MASHGKPNLRGEMRAARKHFVAALRPSVRRLAFRTLPSPAMAHVPDGAVIALYRAQSTEAPTQALAESLTALGHPLCLPRIGKGGAMDFAAWDIDDVLVPGPHRTLQPDEYCEAVDPDVIIAPLVAFDRAMNRLGQGGGYYDRAFERWPDALRIGLGWSAQEADSLPVDPWDMRLHIIVTEREVIERADL